MPLISDIGAYSTTISIAGVGIAFAVYVYIKNRFLSPLDDDLDLFLKRRASEYQGISDSQPLMDNQAANPGYTNSLKLYYQGVASQVQNCTLDLFKTQTLLMLFFAMIFALGFLIWLANEDRSMLLLIAFLLGCLCTSINTFITLKFSTISAIKTAIIPLDDSILSYSYFTASAIAVGTTSLTLLALSIIVPVYINQLNESELNVVGFTAIFSSVLGFGLGSAYASLFYREAGGMSSKGILVGRELISKANYQNYEQTVVEVNLNTASIVSNIYNNNVISVLDFQSIFSAFLCTYMLVLAQSSDAVKDENRSIFYLPLFLVAVNLVVAIGLTFITCFAPAESAKDTSIPQETAKHVRLQVLICNAFSLVSILFTPVFFVMEGFSIGSTDKDSKDAGVQSINNKNIDPSDAVWSLAAGLLAQTILIVYAEIFTSHSHAPVQNIAESKTINKKGGFSMTMLSATETANISQFPIFILFSSAIVTGYLLAGYFGIACSIIGLIAAPISLISVNIFSGLVQESFEVAGIGYLRQMRQRLFSYSWAARNFSIYPQIVTILAVILTSVLGIGACVTISGKYDIYVWDAYGIFGFIIGGSLAYFIKGIGLQGIKKVAENLKEGYTSKNETRDYKTNLREADFLVQGHYKTVILKVAINIFIVILAIVLLGIFLGLQSLLSFLIGINMVGIYLCFNSLIVGYSVKNAREYDRNYGKTTDIDEASVQADITVSATEGIPGTPLLPYLVFATLFVLQGATKWGSYGFFREWVDAGSFNKMISEQTTGVMDSIKNAFDTSDTAEAGGDTNGDSG